MTVQFGAVKIVMQSKAYTPVEEYNEKSEAIRRRIRGDLEVLGADPEVAAAIEQELGKPDFDARKLRDAAEERFSQFVQSLGEKHQRHPNYRALLFNLGHLPNPLNPAKNALQKLLIDGKDIERFQRDIFTHAFFRKTVFPGGHPKLEDVTVHNSPEQYPGKGIEGHFQTVLVDYANQIREEAKQGDTANILDLDA